MGALGNLLVKSAIIPNFSARDAADVAEVLGGRLFEAGFVKDSFVEAALTREQSRRPGLVPLPEEPESLGKSRWCPRRS